MVITSQLIVPILTLVSTLIFKIYIYIYIILKNQIVTQSKHENSFDQTSSKILISFLPIYLLLISPKVSRSPILNLSLLLLGHHGQCALKFLSPPLQPAVVSFLFPYRNFLSFFIPLQHLLSLRPPWPSLPWLSFSSSAAHHCHCQQRFPSQPNPNKTLSRSVPLSHSHLSDYM